MVAVSDDPDRMADYDVGCDWCIEVDGNALPLKISDPTRIRHGASDVAEFHIRFEFGDTAR